ncbi:MAG: hypothetical protein Q4G40_05190 [Brachybacterium sp.]|nr:hypothetical protein [Brachybacterium sp.]
MAPPMRAPLGAAIALLLALSSLGGPLGTILVALVAAGVALLVASGWPDLLELPSARGTRLVIGLTGIAGVGVALWSPGEIIPLQGVAMVGVLGLFLSFGQQMARPRRTALTLSLTGTVAGALLTALSASWVQAQAEAAGAAAPVVTASALALTAALLLLALPLPVRWRSSLAILAAAAVCPTVMSVLPLDVLGTSTVLAGLVLGAMIGIAAAAAHTLLDSQLVAEEPLPSLALAGAPVATVGVIALVAVRLTS